METVMPESNRCSTSALAGAALLSATLAASGQGAGPFSAFAGSFRGGGAVVGSDGHRERITCRANGAVASGGAELSQTIVCASDSYKLDIRARVVAEGGAVKGEWQESTRGVSGSIAGRVSDGNFSGAISGGSFSAGVSLHASGRRLSFGLRPQAGDVSSVNVSLSR
jgi:hypothetical protein